MNHPLIRIARERLRQIEEEGYDQAHDMRHHGEDRHLTLAGAVMAYMAHLKAHLEGDDPSVWSEACEALNVAPGFWVRDFARDHDADSADRLLEIAGALIAADLELWMYLYGAEPHPDVHELLDAMERPGAVPGDQMAGAYLRRALDAAEGQEPKNVFIVGGRKLDADLVKKAVGAADTEKQVRAGEPEPVPGDGDAPPPEEVQQAVSGLRRFVNGDLTNGQDLNHWVRTVLDYLDKRGGGSADLSTIVMGRQVDRIADYVTDHLRPDETTDPVAGLARHVKDVIERAKRGEYIDPEHVRVTVGEEADTEAVKNAIGNLIQKLRELGGFRAEGNMDRIYLGPEGSGPAGGRLWCQDQVFGGEGIPYVRADEDVDLYQHRYTFQCGDCGMEWIVDGVKAARDVSNCPHCLSYLWDVDPGIPVENQPGSTKVGNFGPDEADVMPSAIRHRLKRIEDRLVEDMTERVVEAAERRRGLDLAEELSGYATASERAEALARMETGTDGVELDLDLIKLDRDLQASYRHLRQYMGKIRNRIAELEGQAKRSDRSEDAYAVQVDLLENDLEEVDDLTERLLEHRTQVEELIRRVPIHGSIGIDGVSVSFGFRDSDKGGD